MKECPLSKDALGHRIVIDQIHIGVKPWQRIRYCGLCGMTFLHNKNRELVEPEWYKWSES